LQFGVIAQAANQDHARRVMRCDMNSFAVVV